MGGQNSTDTRKETPAPKPVKTRAKPLPKAGEIDIRAGDFEDYDVKILALGSGECGKVTIRRQLQLIYCGGFDAEQREGLKRVIKMSLVSDAQMLIDTMRRRGLSVAAELSNSVELVSALDIFEDPLVPEVAEQITALWNDPIMKDVYEQANSIGFGEHASFFFDNAVRIAQKSYIPTDEDILKIRVRTTGLNRFPILIDDVKTELLEAGGQKSERARWQRCFPGVTFLMFVVSLSDFDQVLFEDEGVPRTKDSLDLFGSMANSQVFENRQIFLVLNKVDIFKQKLATSPDKFKAAYPGFTGNTDNPDEAIDWVKHCFLSQLNPGRAETARVQVFVCCAMEQESVRDLFQKIGETVLESRQ
jgi:GTPase SAR1 family protein